MRKATVRVRGVLGADSIVSLLRLRRVKSVCVLRSNLPPALLAEWPGVIYCGNKGWNGHRIIDSTRSLIWREQISPAAPAGTWTRNFFITRPALCSYHRANWYLVMYIARHTMVNIWLIRTNKATLGMKRMLLTWINKDIWLLIHANVICTW